MTTERGGLAELEGGHDSDVTLLLGERDSGACLASDGRGACAATTVRKKWRRGCYSVSQRRVPVMRAV